MAKMRQIICFYGKTTAGLAHIGTWCGTG